MRKGLLIGAGTLGGLGAVLTITPPHFSAPNLNTTDTNPAPSQQPTQAAQTPAPTKQAVPTKKAVTPTKKAVTPTKKASSAATKPASTPTPAQTQPQSSTGAVNGTFTGNTFQNRFGPVQVQITVVDGKITAAKALQYPNGDFPSAQISRQAIPYLVQETLQAQSAQIQGVGGASYTSYGWYQSLQSALAKAGMK